MIVDYDDPERRGASVTRSSAFGSTRRKSVEDHRCMILAPLPDPGPSRSRGQARASGYRRLTELAARAGRHRNRPKSGLRLPVSSPEWFPGEAAWPLESRQRRTVGAGRSREHLRALASFLRWWSSDPATARCLLRRGRRAVGPIAAGRRPPSAGGLLGSQVCRRGSTRRRK